ncbi:hypothetical protein [Marinifilum breve]|nr:hypothetical protein [Marinifilum breve]
MKKIHIISIFLIGLLFSCSTSSIDQIDGAMKSAVPDFKLDLTLDGFIDKANPAGEFGFSMDLADGDVTSADVKVAYVNVVTKATSFATIEAGLTEFPYNKSLTVAGIIGLFPDLETTDDLNTGDEFIFYADFKLRNGTVVIGYDESGPNYSDDVRTSPLYTPFVGISVACASNIDGVYDCVANGTSTDPGPSPSENPAVNFTSTITLTPTEANGVYTISDFSGGLFTFWYDIYGLAGDYPGTIKDVCGDISYTATTGPFGSPISGTGSVDESTGVITLTGLADDWGDTWTLVLTPQ